MRRNWIYGLFFLSGGSALMYELIWQRQLNLLFGVSTLSVSAVLAAFMGGLALGGLLFGRLADRSSHPLRSYALLEAGIGVVGLLLPLGFTALTAVYSNLYAYFQPGQWGGACLRFGVAFPLLVGLATLLGGTLPFMGRLALHRDAALPTTFSMIYAVNTLGAVVGAALTGFLLLRVLGMQATLWLAVGVNFLVASVAWCGEAASNEEPIRPINAPEDARARYRSTPSSPVPWIALACAGITGAASMGYEVVWTRVLGILTSNSAYGFALILTVLLLGLGMGGAIQGWWSRRPGDSWMRLAACQALLAAITVGSIPFFRTAPGWLEHLSDGSSVTNVFLGELGLTSIALLAPGVLMGMSLPLLVAGITTNPRGFGQVLGKLYAVNTLGCVAGAIASGFVLIPWLGIRDTFGILTAGTFAVALVAWGLAATQASRWRWSLGVCSVPALIAAWFITPMGEYLKSPVLEPRQLLYYREGNNATVSVIEEPNHTRSILVDGQPVAGTAGTSVIDQKMLAHLPLLLHHEPHRTLTVGFGSGGTSMSMALHHVDVDCVEIEAAVPGAAELFRSENRGVLNDPRFHLILDDARSWLRVAPVHYDVIVTDCTNIQYRSNGDLYTVEYFRSIQERLNPEGVAAAWVPANGIREDDLKTLLRSFRTVYPHTSIWYMNALPTDFLIVVGSPSALNIDLSRLVERMNVPGVREDLEAVGLADPCRLLYTFLAGEERVATYLESGPINTDDRPILSYSTYGASFRSTIAKNLLNLLACREDVARYVSQPASAETMLRHYAASNEILMGHVGYLSGSESAALGHYLRGCQLLPNDPACQELMRASYFRVTRAEHARTTLQERAGHPPLGN